MSRSTVLAVLFLLGTSSARAQVVAIRPPGSAFVAVPGWDAVAKTMLPLLQSQPGSDPSLADLQGVLGHTILRLSVRKDGGLKGLEFVRHLPRDFQENPTLFAGLKPESQVAKLLIAVHAAQVELGAEASALSAKVKAGEASVEETARLQEIAETSFYLPPEVRRETTETLASVRARPKRILDKAAAAWKVLFGRRQTPGLPSDLTQDAVVRAEIEGLLDGAWTVAQKNGTPLGLKPEQLRQLAYEQIQEALASGDPAEAQKAKNAAEWLLKPDADRLLGDAMRSGDEAGILDAHARLAKADLLIAGSKKFEPPPIRIQDLLTEEDRSVRGALTLYLDRALDASAARLKDLGLDPLALFERLLKDHEPWVQALDAGLGPFLQARNEWTNFAALTYLKTGQMIASVGGGEAARRILGPLAKDRNYSLRIPETHPLAREHFVVAEWFASAAKTTPASGPKPSSPAGTPAAAVLLAAPAAHFMAAMPEPTFAAGAFFLGLALSLLFSRTLFWAVIIGLLAGWGHPLIAIIVFLLASPPAKKKD